MRTDSQSKLFFGICFALALILCTPGISINAWGQTIFAPEPEKNSPAQTAQQPQIKNNYSANNTDKTQKANTASPNIVVDEQGRKTLVIHEDSTKAPQSATKKGPAKAVASSPNIVVDEQGRKTLVIHENINDANKSIKTPKAKKRTKKKNKKKESEASNAQQPYWLKKNHNNERPYWLTDAQNKENPYLSKPKTQSNHPYWLDGSNNADQRYWRGQTAQRSTHPYWLPPLPEPQEDEYEDEYEETANAQAAALPPGTKIISYYMFVDEKGITHMADISTDPRYRKVTITVDVKMASGMKRLGSKFTHAGLRPFIMRAATLYNLDPALIAAVIKSESAFDSKAVSWAGAQGLMQLMPRTAREVGCLDPFDPEENIMGGSRYLRKMLNTFNGDLTLAIAAYNAGPERVKKVWRVPNIKETQNYVKIVLRNYEKYKSDY